jgi:hypothetical protein
MRSKLMVVLVLALAVGLVANAAFADKLICITNKSLKGDTTTVGECMAKGDQFAVVDKMGVPHILTKEEADVLQKTNPGSMNLKAYGLDYMKEAPEMSYPRAD